LRPRVGEPQDARHVRARSPSPGEAKEHPLTPKCRIAPTDGSSGKPDNRLSAPVGRGVDLSTIGSAIRAEPPATQGAPANDGRSLFVPGKNCWRVERATRVAFLVDGEEYFGAVRAALAKAQ